MALITVNALNIRTNDQIPVCVFFNDQITAYNLAQWREEIYYPTKTNEGQTRKPAVSEWAGCPRVALVPAQ